MKFLSVKNWNIFIDITKRDFQKKYKNNFLGYSWFFIMPIILWSLYIFVFVGIFGLQHKGQSDGGLNSYLLTLFTGLTVYYYFSDSLRGAVGLFSSKRNFIKKIKFPLETLVYSHVTLAFFGLIYNIFIVFIAAIILDENIGINYLFIPMIIIPLVLFSLGLCFTLASIGIYIPDLDQITQIIIRGLFFVSPVVYSLQSIGNKLGSIIIYSPLTWYIESYRNIVIKNSIPDLSTYVIGLAFSIIVCFLGFKIYLRLRSGFADVA